VRERASEGKRAGIRAIVCCDVHTSPHLFDEILFLARAERCAAVHCSAMLLFRFFLHIPLYEYEWDGARVKELVIECLVYEALSH